VWKACRSQDPENARVRSYLRLLDEN
jgi:hypothetical protein